MPTHKIPFYLPPNMKHHSILALAAVSFLAAHGPAAAQAPAVHYVEPARPYGNSPFLKNAHKAPVDANGPLLVPPPGRPAARRSPQASSPSSQRRDDPP